MKTEKPDFDKFKDSKLFNDNAEQVKETQKTNKHKRKHDNLKKHIKSHKLRKKIYEVWNKS